MAKTSASSATCWASWPCRPPPCTACTPSAPVENFPLAGEPVHAELVRAYGTVKLACARTNRALGAWADDAAKADAIEQACREMADGQLDRRTWSSTACRAAPAPAPT